MSSSFGTNPNGGPSLAVIGGGLAGIAAAEAAARQGFQVDLFEWSRVLGGRAASLFEPNAQRWIDNGQHLVLGCCTEFLALNKRLGLDRFFSLYETIPFSHTGGKRWTMTSSTYLPNRWQLAPAFLRIPFLTLRDRLSTGLSLRKLGNLAFRSRKYVFSGKDRCFIDWLESERVSSSAIEKFWAPLIFSALSETVDNVSLQAVLKVVRDGFLSGRDAMAVHLPKVPLRTIYHDAVQEKMQEWGVRFHFHSRVKRLHWEFNSDESRESMPDSVSDSISDSVSDSVLKKERRIPRAVSLELADGTVKPFDYFVLAVPVYRNWEILESSELDVFAERLGLDRFEPGAITTVHLWLNRPLLSRTCPYSALLGGPGQFLVCHEDENGETSSSSFKGVYHTVVVSASHRLLSDEELTSRGNDLLVSRILEQLQSTFFGTSRDGGDENLLRLMHSRVTTFFDAVFSPSPTVYTNRPSQETPFSNLALAGDWTQTDWPSTLEGAVRSGQKAVDAFTESES